jgi:hypothetical protein
VPRWSAGIRPAIAQRGQPYGTGLGAFRWVVEPPISWLHGFRRLHIRWERDDIREAFLGLAVCLITYRHVQSPDKAAAVSRTAGFCGTGRHESDLVPRLPSGPANL